MNTCMADRNNPEIQFSTAERHYYGRDGTIVDRARAFKWYSRAAEQGHAEAQFVLGLMYEHGRGVDQSLLKAAGWYKRASQAGHAGAMNNLGCMYYEGSGLHRDAEKAAELFLKAAGHGHASAQFNLSIMYLFGKGGIKRDPAKAFKWCLSAAEQGDVSACYRLSWLYEHAVGTSHDGRLARLWFMRAQGCNVAAGGEDDGLSEYNMTLECGGGVSQKTAGIKDAESQSIADQYRSLWKSMFTSPRNVEVRGGVLTNDYCIDCRFCCGPQPDGDEPFPMALLDRQITRQTGQDLYMIDRHTACLDQRGCRALGPNGCNLKRDLRPVACNIFPYVLINRRLYLYRICPVSMFLSSDRIFELAEVVRLWLDVQPEADIRRISIYRSPDELEEKYIDLSMPIHGRPA